MILVSMGCYGVFVLIGYIVCDLVVCDEVMGFDFDVVVV